MSRTRAVLLDRDNTLIVDVPYNGDPERVEPIAGVRLALDLLRSTGILTAVISNQSGVGRGLITLDQVRAVNRRVEMFLGHLGPWMICPHAPNEGCSCRKPAPGLIYRAAEALGVIPSECVVMGDQPADMEAARSAGARGILIVPDAAKRPHGAVFYQVACNLREAVELVLQEAADRL